MLFGARRGVNGTFRKSYSLHCDIPIRFVGVWDTVDAVGLPFRLSDVINATVYQFKFSDHRLSPLVKRASQALAIDEPRESFAPLLWQEDSQDRNRINQVWFAGAHSNVGGGYPKQGMSLVALDWLLSEAERPLDPSSAPDVDPARLKGLRISANERQSFREHASVDDKLYDPRSGIGVFYRWKIRDIEELCAANNVKPKVHVSVLERIAHGTDDYSPGNLPANAEVVFTPPPKGADTELAARRVKALQEVVTTIPNSTLLNLVRRAVQLGRASYGLYLASCIVSLLALDRVFSGQSHLLNFDADVLGIAAAAGFLAAYLMATIADRRMEGVFSGFWYPKQKILRTGLKQARQLAQRPARENAELRAIRSA
jgi:hypothetical protein